MVAPNTLTRTDERPPARSLEPVLHLSAGRYLAARRYVIGWPQHSLVKIGCTSGPTRVRRFARIPGAEVIDLAYYERLYDDVRSEVWLDREAGQRWPSAFAQKDDARFLLGTDLGGWTEFYDIPLQDWPELRRLAAL